ncbi:kelch domain-containing protein 8B-like [Dendronephthya gigantea]|uniref:kelch domain-containing protein 8B-like n=1 Tax=Dendronephthya gigantea TaxID=151771 RepID=UPI00106D8EA3|nr:kelch domain-containing protein 8B-like [Dendronephthya gigantea]
MVAEKYSSQVSGKDQQSFRQIKDEEFSKGEETERKLEEIFDTLDQAGSQNLQTVKISRLFAEKGDKVIEKHDDMYEELKRMKERFDEMKQSQKAVKEEVMEIKDDFQVIKQKFERVEGLFVKLFQENIVDRNGAQATDPTISTNNQDVIILGGWYSVAYAPPLNTGEKYNIVEKRSTMLPQLNHRRGASASCVHNNDILVVGGFDGEGGTVTIEVLKMNQHPLRWTMFDGKLPVKLSDHDVIVYQGKLYVIGGYDGNDTKTSNAIYEISLAPPYTAKLLARMTGPRDAHRAELLNGKLFILGGTTTGYSKDALDGVVVYDLVKNEFKPCPSLPRPVFDMSTVTWGDKIIILGGMDTNSQALNDVIMYDTDTGRSERLPFMICQRAGCSAVILNDVIVVFGGWNEEQGFLNSVETFTIGGDSWKELPGMIEKRCWANAVVKPHI